MTSKHEWFTKIAKGMLRERRIIWQCPNKEDYDTKIADIVTRTLALGCVQGLCNENLEHLAQTLYSDIKEYTDVYTKRL
jgi:hypothetical protein